MQVIGKVDGLPHQDCAKEKNVTPSKEASESTGRLTPFWVTRVNYTNITYLNAPLPIDAASFSKH